GQEAARQAPRRSRTRNVQADRPETCKEDYHVSDNEIIKKTITDTALNRRSFLKWSAALSGTAVLASSTGAGLTSGLKKVQAAPRRSEERRVGKEGRAGRARDDAK